jgi:hypothetical protein
VTVVSTYNILSFCTNWHFCFLICFYFFFNVVFQNLYPEKITELSQVTEKVHLVRTLSRTFNLCAMWKALVVVTYDTLPGERHWSWYRMTYWHVKYTGCVTIWRIVMLHWSWYRMAHWQVKGTGRGTVWHIVMWKALVMAPYDTLPGKRHWSWYRKTHCQMKGTGRGSVWCIARWKTLVVVPYDILPCEIHWMCYRMAHCHVALVVVPYGALSGERHWSWYRMTHCHVKGTSHGTVWHIDRWEALVVVPYNTLTGGRHWSWYRMTHFNTWPRWKRIQTLHKFRNYDKSIWQHLFFCVERKCKITYFYVTNNPLRLNVTLLFFWWSFTTILFNFVSIDNKDGHHIEGIC